MGTSHLYLDNRINSTAPRILYASLWPCCLLTYKNKNMIETIKENEVMKQILADSYGGVLYDVANRDKYDATELLAQWDALPANDKERAGGLIKGAINFLKS